MPPYLLLPVPLLPEPLLEPELPIPLPLGLGVVGVGVLLLPDAPLLEGLLEDGLLLELLPPLDAPELDLLKYASHS
jgi:hypothetical protein